jgi:hypothetical protein
VCIVLYVDRSTQDGYENFFCAVDLHAITVPHDPKVRYNCHIRFDLTHVLVECTTLQQWFKACDAVLVSHITFMFTDCRAM